MARVISDDDIAPVTPAAGRVISDDDVAVDHAQDPGLGQQVSDFFGHTWAGVSGAVGGTAHLVKTAFTNPQEIIDAAHEELKRSADQIEKGTQAWKAGEHSKAIGHWKMAVPVLGPLDQQVYEEGQRGESGAQFGDFVGLLAGAKLLSAAGKAIPKTPGAIRGAASGIRTAAETTADVVRNPSTAAGNLARAIPESVTATVLPAIERAATLSPAAQDALKMVGGSPIVGGANTAARGARTLGKVIRKAQGIGIEEPTRGAAPASGVAYPGAQDPAAVQPRTPVVDEAVDATPARGPRVVTEDDIAPAQAAPYPGQQNPASVEPMAPQIDDAVAATPIRPTAAAEPVQSAAAPSAAVPPPAGNLPASNIPPTEVQAVDNNLPAAGEPVSNVPAPAAAVPAAAAQRPLLEEPAYDRALDEHGQPAKPDYQAAARTVKARALARFLNNPPEGPAITADEASRMTEADWKTIAKEAGVNAPSFKDGKSPAAELAIDHLRELEGKRAQRRLGTGTEAPGEPAPAAATLPADGGNTQGPSGQAAQPSEGLPAAPQVQPSANTGEGATVVRIPGEDTTYPAQYRVRELADIQTSHNGQTFQRNPKYRYSNDRDYSRRENQAKVVEGALPGKFVPELHITDNVDPSNGPPIVDQGGNALGGNGRGMMLGRVYAGNPEGATAYRELLTKKATQFGLNADDVAKMKQPVLVREVADAHLANPQDAITDLNKTGTQSLRPAERARADARRVSHGTLDDMAQRLEKAGPDVTLQRLLSGPDGPQVLDRLVTDGVITKQELPGFVDKGKLTPAAQQRISKLMLGRFFRDPAQLDTIPANVRTKLERLAGPLAKLEGAGEWNLMPTVQEALDLLDEAQAHGSRNLPDFIKQSGLFGESKYSPDAVTMAKQLQRISAPRLAEQLKEYSAGEQYAREHAHAKSGLFGADVQGEPPNPRQSFDDAFGYSGKAPAVSTPATTAKPKPAAKPKSKGVAGKIGDQFLKD